MAVMTGFLDSVEIAPDDPAAPDAALLLRAHAEHAEAHSPPGACHYLDADALAQPDVTFFTARAGGLLMGCAALKALPGAEGEIKSMHVARSARERGIGRALLERLISEAGARGWSRLSLETGASDGFAASRALYLACGFRMSGPFAGYAENDFSVFMTRTLQPR